MADYAVRINNPFASLIGGQVSIPPAAKKKNKKAKAAAAANSADVTVMPGGGVAVGGHAAVSDSVIDEFEPVKDSKKKRKEKKAAESKQKEEATPAAPAEPTAADKHVRFGEASQNGHTEQKRRSSLKRDQNDKKGDSAIVNQFVSMGFPIADVIAAIDELEQDGQDPYKDTTKLLKRLQEVEVARVTKGAKPAAESVNLLDGSAPAAQPKGKKNAAAKAAAAAAIAAEQAAAAASAAAKTAPAPSAEDAEWSTASGKKGKKKSKKDGADVPATPAKAAPAPTAASPRPAERKEQKKEEKAVPVEESAGPQLSATERVETTARNWDPFGEDGLSSLEKWASRLESAERTKQSKGTDTEGHVLFWHSFTASKALEELSRNILLGKLNANNNQQANTVNKAENLILRIFDTTLFGSSTHHKWLLSSLRSLSRPIVACHAKEELISKILALITNQKQGRVAHSQLAELLLESAAASKKQAPKAENKQRDPFSELQESSEDATTALSVRFESVRNIHASLSKVLSAEALTQTFRALEREIVVQLDRSRKELSSLQQQKESVSHKREGLAMSQKMELERLQQQERQVTAEKLALQDKKRELMLELDRVDSRIKAIEADQARIATGISNIQTNSSSNSQNLVHMESELNSRINALGKDESAAQVVTKFIEDVRSRVLEASNKDHQQLEQAFRNSSRSYLSQLRDYLDRHHALLVFLKDRISFCTNKLNQAKEEKARMQQLGISGSLSTKNAADLAEMSAMVEQDNTAIQRISTKVLHAVQSAAKHIREFGIHTDSQSGYGAFLSELRTKRSTTPGFSFDISVLPEPSTAPAAQPAAASSSAGNLALNLSASNMYTYSSPPTIAPAAATSKTIAPARPSAISAYASTLPVIPGMISGPSISLSDMSSSAPAPTPAPAPAPAAATPAPAPSSPSADASADGANGRRKPPMVRGTRGGPRVMSATAAPAASVAISFEESSAPPPPPAAAETSAPAAPSSASGPRRKAPPQAPTPSKKAWAVNAQAAASETGADFPTLGTDAPATEEALQSPQSGKQKSKRTPPGFSSPTPAEPATTEAEVTLENADN